MILRITDADGSAADTGAEQKVSFVLHRTIQQVTKDIEHFEFNTAIARLMELTNAMYKYMDGGVINAPFIKNVALDFLKLLAPFAPHFAEELWSRMGQPYSIFNAAFPVFDESQLKQDTCEMAFQVCGKVKGRFEVETGKSKEEIEALVKEKFAKYFEGKEIVKLIIVPGRIVNAVLK